MVRQKPDKANRTQKSRRKGNPAAETFRNKTAYQNRSKRKPRIRHSCRVISLHRNPPARSPPPHLARYRHGRKNNHSSFAMLKDRRCPPSGNSARLEQTFDCAFTRIKRGENLPNRLATPLAQNQGQFWFSRTLGSGRASPHIRKLPRKTLRRSAAPSTEYGTPRLVASALPLHQYARHFPRRRKMLLRTPRNFRVYK